MARLSFDFWQRWLLWACVGAAVLGVALAVFDTRLMPAFPEAVNRSVWGTRAMPQDVVIYHRFMHAVLGATIASWAIALAFIAHYPFRARRRWAWSCICAALLVWFSLDTALSLYFGVWPNAIFNLGALVFIGTPLVFTRGAFYTDADRHDQGASTTS